MSRAELLEIFKPIYQSWEEWARTGDPDASRLVLLEALVDAAFSADFQVEPRP